ncbi:hypothetical protein AgCh_004794 [Apium graveolens]
MLQKISRITASKLSGFESGLSQEFADEDESRGTETQGWSPLLLAPNDNSGERAAPSDGVPGPSVRGHGGGSDTDGGGVAAADYVVEVEVEVA